MNNKLSANFAHTDGLDVLHGNPSLDVGVLQVVHRVTCDEQTPLLLFLVVVEFENGATHVYTFFIN
jgi:hypothetical protein